MKWFLIKGVCKLLCQVEDFTRKPDKAKMKKDHLLRLYQKMVLMGDKKRKHLKEIFSETTKTNLQR